MKPLSIVLALAGVSLLAVACAQNSGADTGKVIKSTSVGNNLTVTLSNNNGALKHGDEEFFLTFKDNSGKPVDAGAVALTFQMPAMGTMPAMNNATTFTTTSTPGVYKGRVKLESAGDWQAQISYEGPAGKGKTSFSITAQ
ncbi:MAG TPA: FixH family protein [Pyrinomonadaceae bacterium]|nr:FixH family protein [Pyrinomonadaceae bacterium]